MRSSQLEVEYEESGHEPIKEEGTTDNTDFHRYSAELFQMLGLEIGSICG